MQLLLYLFLNHVAALRQSHLYVKHECQLEMPRFGQPLYCCLSLQGPRVTGTCKSVNHKTSNSSQHMAHIYIQSYLKNICSRTVYGLLPDWCWLAVWSLWTLDHCCVIKVLQKQLWGSIVNPLTLCMKAGQFSPSSTSGGTPLYIALNSSWSSWIEECIKMCLTGYVANSASLGRVLSRVNLLLEAFMQAKKGCCGNQVACSLNMSGRPAGLSLASLEMDQECTTSLLHQCLYFSSYVQGTEHQRDV